MPYNYSYISDCLLLEDMLLAPLLRFMQLRIKLSTGLMRSMWHPVVLHHRHISLAIAVFQIGDVGKDMRRQESSHPMIEELLSLNQMPTEHSISAQTYTSREVLQLPKKMRNWLHGGAKTGGAPLHPHCLCCLSWTRHHRQCALPLQLS